MASRFNELLVDNEGQVKGVRYRKVDEMTSLATVPYRWLARTAKPYRISFLPLAIPLNYVADAQCDRAANERALKANAVILAAGGFHSKLPLS